MVYRVYVEKKPQFAAEASSLTHELRDLLGICALENIRIINRYDVEGIDEALFNTAVKLVFSEPQVDDTSLELSLSDAHILAVESLPGQFDQRADSAAQCIQIISQQERPIVRYACIYALFGNLSEEDMAKAEGYLINPVETRKASLEMPKTLAIPFDAPKKVAILDGFREMDENARAAFIKANGLAMDMDDLTFCQDYFVSEKRDPTITEIKMIDTYWSDHCRHTTFNTTIDSVTFEDELVERAYKHYLDTRKDLNRTKPICLMDLGTLAVRALKAAGKLEKLDESEEINACTVKIDVDVDGETQKWLLLFKNETHNHPTEIEPFGGAATCIGGAIRDPLSGRSYVYGAMRLTGAADPRCPLDKTIPGKLPQRTIVTKAAAGYSSYGNQIGLATGMVDELYHPGYAAKRMEVGAVIAAAPAENVRRERPSAGDVVILLGGDTGRDGIGGATGSSKAHDIHSVETCGAEVQKGNAPEERKLQRLFRDKRASRMIKRCNDFGAGGVSVAIGELAAGVHINLDAVPKKYEGLDGTELAIAESQERMAVVVEAKDAEEFLTHAARENLKATIVAEVTAEERVIMEWQGDVIVNLSREFLDSNGAEKHITIEVEQSYYEPAIIEGTFEENMLAVASDLNCASKQGLSERFDSTIGAGTVLMPFGGKNQRTPIQAMCHTIPVLEGNTTTCSLMSWGFNPMSSEMSPYHGAFLAVVESCSKLVASGAAFEDVYLSFQEYFEKLGRNPKRWQKPFKAILGAFEAQMQLGVGSIGGKDSMSGSFEDLDVPPTLISFAVTTAKTQDIVSPEFKQAGNRVIFLAPEYDEEGLPIIESLLGVYERVHDLMQSGKAVACYTPGMGGCAEAVLKMALGNGIGMTFADDLDLDDIFALRYGSFILEVVDDVEPDCTLGVLNETASIDYAGTSIPLATLEAAYDGVLEDVFPTHAGNETLSAETLSYKTEKRVAPAIAIAKPKVLIPVFPGTNCEYDTARAFREAGGEPDIFVIKNLSSDAIAQSAQDFASKLDESQIVFIPGGFSGGDEPDGSGKFITAFFRNPVVREALEGLLDNRDGLMGGICNGFQALIKLGLVPYGKIIDADANCPTLTFNTIHRHQSRLVRTRVASNKSPWLAACNVGDIYTVPISHGEGRFIVSDELLSQLIANGQVATQYVDLDGNATFDIRFNPNGSICAIEGITSPDGRVFGKMGHSERKGKALYKNVPGEFDIHMFESAVKYFTK